MGIYTAIEWKEIISIYYNCLKTINKKIVQKPISINMKLFYFEKTKDIVIDDDDSINLIAGCLYYEYHGIEAENYNNLSQSEQTPWVIIAVEVIKKWKERIKRNKE